jgi:hypothetical protein
VIDRRIAGGVLVAIVGITLVVVFLVTPGSGAPTASRSPRPSVATLPSPVGTANPMAPLEDAITVVDGRFDARAERTVRGPTRHKNQSKLFFAEGSWWGVLQEPTSREARIHRLDWESQRWHDTGVVVDERAFARADVLYADGLLYVASAGGSDSPSHAIRVGRFRFDPGSARWSQDPDFPVVITQAGVESALIERATDGTLWVAFIAAGRLLVAHSLGDDHLWTPPFRPDVTGTDVASDQVGLAATRGEVVLLWSNQNDEAIYATSRADGAPDDAWTAVETVVSGLAAADNHVNIKALPDGRVFAAVKTSLDTVPRNQPGWDQVLLVDRVAGVWSSKQFGQIRDRHTRPIVVLDTEHDEALVFATAPTRGGAIYMKHAPLDDLGFPVGRGVAVLATEALTEINDATSTKQAVDASTGLVVLAADDPSGRYVHLAASLGGPPPGVPAGDPPDAPEPPGDDPIDLVRETYDSFVVGETLHAMWRTPPTRSSGTVTYVDRDEGDLAVRLRTTSTGEYRPCRAVPPTTSGTVTISADVRLDRQGPMDTVLLMARGDGDEVAGLRVDAQRRVRISRLDERVTTRLRIRRGVWYRVEFDIDVEARRFDVRLRDAGGDVLLERTRQRWRSPLSTAVDGICVAASRGRSGLGMSFDDVRVTRVP